MQLKNLKDKTLELDVLYVEDDLYLQKQNKEILEQLFHNIEVASDGEMAYKIYLKGSFDIVITDINIPKINGFTLIKMMQEKNPTQKFLITTVFKKDEFKKELEELNLSYFLSKPIQTKDFLANIEKIVNSLACI